MKPHSTSDPALRETELRTPGFEDRIRRRAYDLYEQRGRADGNDMDDWLRAEAELTGRLAKSASA